MPTTHPAKELATELAAALATLTLSRTFTAERVWIPKRITRESLEGANPLVLVAPSADAATASSRGGVERTFAIDIAIIAAVPSIDPTDVDPLIDFAEELLEACPSELTLDNQGQKAWYDSVETPVLCDPESLAKLVFFHVSQQTWGLFQ